MTRLGLRMCITSCLLALAVAACGQMASSSSASRPIRAIPRSLSGVLAFSGSKLKLKGFPASAVPLPVGEPVLAAQNASTPHRQQFLLTYAAPTAQKEARFMSRYVGGLERIGFQLQQHEGAGTPGALYSLVDHAWEILVEGSSSTVQVSVVERR